MSPSEISLKYAMRYGDALSGCAQTQDPIEVAMGVHTVIADQDIYIITCVIIIIMIYFSNSGDIDGTPGPQHTLHVRYTYGNTLTIETVDTNSNGTHHADCIKDCVACIPIPRLPGLV